MAFLNPFSGGINSIDKSWVDHISKTLKSQLEVTIDTPPVSIFKIPETLKAEKLQAYTPQRIGLGPNHHFQSELYQKMEQNKLTAVKRVLSPHLIRDYQDKVVQKVKEIIPVVCACYDVYLDANNDTLAWLFAIDGLFLLDHLGAYSYDRQFGIEANDLIMLENQIPLIVLKEIQKVISDEKTDQVQTDYLESKLNFFCKCHSPFLLSKKEVDLNRVNHILDYMYQSIVNNKPYISRGVYFRNLKSRSPKIDAKQELLEALIKMGGLIPGAKPFLGIVNSILKNLSESVEKKPFVEQIKVPSVSRLGDVARVKFRLSPENGGLRNIKFVVDNEERSCYLPLITLNIDSEVILRNLVAYEQLMAKNCFGGGFGLELTEYVEFMCGIIDTAVDVRLLRKENIIGGDLGDEKIVKLFNGIGRSDAKMGMKSDLRKIVAELNKVYESTPSVWVQMTAEKQVRVSAKLITFLVSSSSTLILIREVYSKVYGSNPPHMMLVHFLLEQIESFSLLIQ